MRGPKFLWLAMAGFMFGQVPATAQQQQQQRPSVLPSDSRDYDCYVLLGASRNRVTQNSQISATQRAQAFADLNVLVSFYSGRISHYPANEAKAYMQRSNSIIAGLNAQQLQEGIQGCQNYYQGVQNTLGRLSGGN